MSKIKAGAYGFIAGSAMGITSFVAADAFIQSHEFSDRAAAYTCAEELPAVKPREVEALPKVCHGQGAAYAIKLSMGDAEDGANETYVLQPRDEYLKEAMKDIRHDKRDRATWIIGAGLIGTLGGALLGLVFNRAIHRQKTKMVPLDDLFFETPPPKGKPKHAK